MTTEVPTSVLMPNTPLNRAPHSWIEGRSIDYVPEDERHGKVSHQAPFWFLTNFSFMSIAVGFVGPSLGLSFAGTVIASIIGVLIGTTFQAFHATQGPTLGLPQMIQSRAQFGFRGAIVPLIAAMLSPLTFNIVASLLISEGLVHLWGIDRTAAILCCAFASGSLAIFGHDMMHRIFRILFWLCLPLYVVLSFALFGYHEDTAIQSGGWVWAAFFTQLATTASLNLGLAPYVSDHTRYLPKETGRANIIAQVFMGSAVSAVWLIAIGAFLAVQFGASDGLVALYDAANLITPGMGTILVGLSVCALVATVGMNTYGGMLMVITTADSLKRVKLTQRLRLSVLILFTAVWASIAASLSGDAIGYVGAAMIVLLYALIPWTAINLADFFLIRRGEYNLSDLFSLNGAYGEWNARGLTAYVAGIVASIPFVVIPGFYVGPVAALLGEVDLGWLVGLFVAGSLYTVRMSRETH